MEKLSRSELRYKIMTILYQIFLYNKNKINYSVDDVIKKQMEIENNFVKETTYKVLEHQEEIDKIKCIFLEKYNGETESFYSLYENIDDLKQGSKLLMHYVDESLKGENSMGGR